MLYNDKTLKIAPGHAMIRLDEAQDSIGVMLLPEKEQAHTGEIMEMGVHPNLIIAGLGLSKLFTFPRVGDHVWVPHILYRIDDRHVVVKTDKILCVDNSLKGLTEASSSQTQRTLKSEI